MVLHAANKGATKTRIMYGAYLSYDQVGVACKSSGDG
jgi:predicted transcriptional regulator